MSRLGVIYRTSGQPTGDPDWDSGTGFTSRQLRLALDLPVRTVSYAVLAGGLLATFGTLFVAGGVYDAAFPWFDDALVERWG